MAMPRSDGDTGSGEIGVALPDGSQIQGNVTVTHTVLILVGALIGLWLLGGVAFRSIRM